MYVNIPSLCLVNMSVSVLFPNVREVSFLIFLRADCGHDDLANERLELKIEFCQLVLNYRYSGM